MNPEVDIHYGEAVSSEIQLNLLRTDDVSRIDWKDEITVSLGYEKNNNIIWDVIGTYYGDEPSQLYSKTNVITFIGYDKMTKYGQILADDLIASINFPINNEDLMDELATQLGITVTEEAPRLFQVLLYKNNIQTGATIRDILAWLAEVNGESAVKSVYADEVKFITYSKPKYSVDYTLTTDDYFAMDRSDVYVQSVPCFTFVDTANSSNAYKYPSGASGVPYTIVNNPFFKGLDNNDKDLVASMTLQYRLTFDNNHDIPSFIPMKVDAIGNYMVEAGDVINIVDEDNNTLPLVIFSRTLTWTGGFLRDEYECTGGTERQEMTSTEQELYSVQKVISNSIANSLNITTKGMALDASQGKILNDKIEWKKATFTAWYPNSTTTNFQEFSMPELANATEIVGFVGASGSTQMTAIHLMVFGQVRSIYTKELDLKILATSNDTYNYSVSLKYDKTTYKLGYRQSYKGSNASYIGLLEVWYK